MKRLILFTFCFTCLLSTVSSQTAKTQVGLSLKNYELPKNRTSFSNSSQTRYYKAFLNKKNNGLSLVFNQEQLKKDSWRSFLVNTLHLFGSGNSLNLGSFGIPSPAHNPLVNTRNNANGHLLLQQNTFQLISN